MSWNANFTSKQSFQSETERAAQREAAVSQNAEAGDQFDAAVRAAQGIIDSGAAGGSDKDFSVYLSGHANPQHSPRPGYANDGVYVTITQK